MEDGTTKREQKNGVDNFTSIDIDILLMQNKSLMAELLRLREASQSAEKRQQIESQSNRALQEAYNRTRGSVSHFLKIFENFAVKSNLTWVYSLYEVVSENLVEFVELLNTGGNMKASAFDLVYKFEELFTTNSALFGSGYKLDERQIDEARKVDILTTQNAELLSEVSRLRGELDAYKQQTPEFKQLREDLELLAWKNKILENRAAFMVDLEINDIGRALEVLEDESFGLCYCGGKSFRALKGEVKDKLTAKMMTKPVEVVARAETRSDAEADLKIAQLKKELADIIEVAEKRRVDKAVVGRQILNSNFVYDIKQHLNDYYEYIRELEMRIETYNEYLIDIERERVKELESYKLRELKDKQRLEEKIYELKTRVIDLESSESRIKATKQDSTSSTDHQDRISQFSQIAKSQGQTIETLTSRILSNLETKAAENKKVISYLEKKLYAFKDHDITNSKYLDKDFRHSTHKKIFERLYKAFEGDAETVAQLRDMEKYVKAREEKIHSLEKKVKKQAEQLDHEQANSKALIQEIANSAVAFQKIQGVEEVQRNDLLTAEENFTKLYREKNEERVSLERQLLTVRAEVESLGNQNQLNLQMVKTLKRYTKQKDFEVNDANRKVRELTNSLATLASEKNRIKALLDQKDTEVVILNNRIQGIEASVSKLSSQIADNLSIIAEKESIIKSVIASSRSNTGELPDVSNSQKEEYFINKLELRRLRDLLICKVCNVNEKTVVLSSCFHTFCEDCVQQKLKSRDRNCPVCMVKINKYDVQKLYLG